MSMTKKDFMAKYGSATVRFSSYYKYTFTYSATLPNGSVLSVSIGGNSDDIYRLEVVNNDEQTVGYLDPCAGTVYDPSAKQAVESFYDY